MRWRVQSRWPLASVQAQLFYGGLNSSFEDIFESVLGGSAQRLLAVSPLLKPTATSWAFTCAPAVPHCAGTCAHGQCHEQLSARCAEHRV